MYEQAKTLSPYYNVPDTNKPNSISGNLTLLAPANNIISEAIECSNNEIDFEDPVLSKLNAVVIE